MSKFKLADFSQKQDTQADSSGSRVMKIEGGSQTTRISEFSMPKLNTSGQGSYAATKAKFGPLAVTDPERTARVQKDRRFLLSPLLRDPLAVEQEERRAIEERVKVAVAEIADSAREEAYQAGHAIGLKEGYAEAFSKFKQEGELKLDRLESLLMGLEGAKDEIFSANERFLVEVIFRVSKLVMLKELSMDKEYLSRLIRDLIDRIGVRDNLRIRLNAQDAETIGKIRADLEKSLGAMKNLNIETSRDVQLGGCIVESEWSMIDATIETQLQGIYQALFGVAENSAGGGQ